MGEARAIARHVVHLEIGHVVLAQMVQQHVAHERGDAAGGEAVHELALRVGHFLGLQAQVGVEHGQGCASSDQHVSACVLHHFLWGLWWGGGGDQLVNERWFSLTSRW